MHAYAEVDERRGEEGRRRVVVHKDRGRQPKSSKVTNEDAGVKGSDGRKGGELLQV